MLPKLPSSCFAECPAAPTVSVTLAASVLTTTSCLWSSSAAAVQLHLCSCIGPCRFGLVTDTQTCFMTSCWTRMVQHEVGGSALRAFKLLPSFMCVCTSCCKERQLLLLPGVAVVPVGVHAVTTITDKNRRRRNTAT